MADRLWLAQYRWRRVEPLSWARLGVPLPEARVGLVTSAGLYRSQVDKPFRRTLGGDGGFRIIPDHVDLRTLAVGQTRHALDRRPGEADRNAVLPTERLRTLAAQGEVGSAAPRHLNFNGSITAPAGWSGRARPQLWGCSLATVCRRRCWSRCDRSARSPSD